MRGIIGGAQFFIGAFKQSPPPTQAAIIAGCSTALASVVTLVIGGKFQQKREIEAEHRKRKAEVYDEFMEFFFDLFTREKQGKEALNEQEIIEFLSKFHRNIIVWGSDQSLKDYTRFYEFYTGLAKSSGDQSPEMLTSTMINLTTYLLAIRRDLGHKNKNIQPKDVLRLFINDIDDYIP